MQIIAHRGFWEQEQDKNSYFAFQKSFTNGFGVETDLRDFTIKNPPPPRTQSEIAISHDIPTTDSLNAKEFFKLYQESRTQLPIALNIKADGLQAPLKYLLESYNITNYFVFDMSIPDCLCYINLGFHIFTRQSEYEIPIFYDKAQGVWLDEFHTHWITPAIIKEHLHNGKKVCIVSPELHKRNYKTKWQDYKELLKTLDDNLAENLMLCTDYPHIANDFFKSDTRL